MFKYFVKTFSDDFYCAVKINFNNDVYRVTFFSFVIAENQNNPIYTHLIHTNFDGRGIFGPNRCIPPQQAQSIFVRLYNVSNNSNNKEIVYM